MASIMKANPWTLERGEDRDTGLERWSGVGSYLTYAANAPYYAQDFHGTVIHTGVSGDLAPRVRRTRIIYWPDGMRGRALLVCQCESPPPTGRARVYTRTLGMDHKVLIDLDGKTVSGPDQHSGNGSSVPDNPVGDGMSTWVVLQGSNNVEIGLEDIVLETAYPRSEFDPTAALDLYNTVNDAPLSQLNRDAGTVRFVGRETDTSWGDEFVVIRYRLQWSKVPWNDLLKVQKCVYTVVVEPSFTFNPSTGDYTQSLTDKEVLRLLPAKERYKDGDTWKIRTAYPESRRVFEEASFSNLDSLAVWSS